MKLFYRDGRQMHLTEAGTAVLQWADDVLTHTRELERHLTGLSDGSQGDVVLGASMTIGSYMLPSILSSFLAAHPAVNLRLAISDTEHAVEDTRTGALDFSIVVTEGDVEISGMEVEQISSSEIVLVAAPEGEPREAVIAPEKLAQLSYVEAPEGIIRRSFIERRLRSLGIADRRVVLELGHAEAMKRAVQDGLGVTFLFRPAVQGEFDRGVLREVRVEGIDMTIPICVVSRKDKTFSALHRALIDTICQGLMDYEEARQLPA